MPRQHCTHFLSRHCTRKIKGQYCTEQTDYFKECNFITTSADAGEARKMSEETELVFGKVIIKGYNRVIPCCFLLKC